MTPALPLAGLILMQQAYYLTHWAGKYENSDLKKSESMPWYKKQTKLVGLGIGRTLREQFPRNAQLLGLWTLIETLACGSDKAHRGWLVRDGQALTADTMADLIPTIGPDGFADALKWFCNINWLVYAEFNPDKPTPPGKSSGQYPDKPPTPPQPPVIHPGRGERGERGEENREEKRGEHPPDAPLGPSLEEVLKWGGTAGIDPAYLELKFNQAIERGDFAKVGWDGTKWQSKFQRFWKEDGPAWKKKNKKNAAPGGKTELPPRQQPGWISGDADWWWTDDLTSVEGALRGALLQKNEKTAARLREIIQERKK